jgi:hypothetical protein
MAKPGRASATINASQEAGCCEAELELPESPLHGRRSASKDQGDNKQNQKDDEEYVSDPRSFTRNTA